MTRLSEYRAQTTGADTYYSHPLFRKLAYTRGVQILAETCGAYWLVGKIMAISPTLPEQDFQAWKFDGETVTCDDGNGRQLHYEKIDFTDFPPADLPARIWVENSTLYLPEER